VEFYTGDSQREGVIKRGELVEFKV